MAPTRKSIRKARPMRKSKSTRKNRRTHRVKTMKGKKRMSLHRLLTNIL